MIIYLELFCDLDNVSSIHQLRPILIRIMTVGIEAPQVKLWTEINRFSLNNLFKQKPYKIDTCGGIVNIPLSFDRLTTFESSQFPEERAFPLICNWNVKVILFLNVIISNSYITPFESNCITRCRIRNALWLESR